MESMARSISTHSLRMAFGSRGADAGGLTRLCISTSPVEERERESDWDGFGQGFCSSRSCAECVRISNGDCIFTIISPSVCILNLVVWWAIMSPSFNLIISPVLLRSGLRISPTWVVFGGFLIYLSVGFSDITSSS